MPVAGNRYSQVGFKRPWTKGFTWEKLIIGYNFGMDDGAESKFGTCEKLIVLNIFNYEYCVNNKSCDMSVTILPKIVNY